MEWNKIYYIDCMNEENGLPTLEDKSIDLCLTDPPYNKKFDGYSGYNQKYKKKVVYYEDNMKPKDYYKWCKSWFLELKRICNNIIISVGNTNLNLWYKLTYINDTFYNINLNGNFGSKIALFNKIEPWIFIGKTKQQFNMNISQINNKIIKHTIMHPCPRNKKVTHFIISNLKQVSVIDPFMGSGTTAEVCTKLEIPWIGYEINKIYKRDFKERMKSINNSKSGVKYWLK